MESCRKCGEEYTDTYWNWCKPCQIDNLKGNFTNWTSGNKSIDNFIQEMQLKIDCPTDLVFEWVPYNQFSDLKEIGKGGFATVYSAIWKDGPLNYDDDKKEYWKDGHDDDKKEYLRSQDKKVALKCLHNSQNITNEFLNEV